MLIIYLIKCQQSSLHWILFVQNKFSLSFNKPTGCGNIPNFFQIHYKISEKMDIKVFNFSYNYDLKWRSRSSKHIKMRSLVFPIIIPSLKEIGLQMSDCKATLRFFQRYLICRVLSLDNWMDEIKTNEFEVHHTTTSQQYTIFHSNGLNTVRKLVQKLLLSCTLSQGQLDQ